MNNDHVERVHDVICGNRRLTVQEVADEAVISTGSCHQIFNEKLKMRRISAKFVLTRCSSSAVIWQNIRHPLCPTHPVLQTQPQQTFSCFLNLKLL
jgi:hypothetical protein